MENLLLPCSLLFFCLLLLFLLLLLLLFLYRLLPFSLQMLLVVNRSPECISKSLLEPNCEPGDEVLAKYRIEILAESGGISRSVYRSVDHY